VAAVGIEYLRRTPSVRALLMRELRIENEGALERWTAFWLALHDLGKILGSVSKPKARSFRRFTRTAA
jgi:hypothetical protein